MRVSILLWLLAVLAFLVAALADSPPWWGSTLQWVAGGLALLTAGLLFYGTARDQL